MSQNTYYRDCMFAYYVKNMDRYARQALNYWHNANRGGFAETIWKPSAILELKFAHASQANAIGFASY